MITSKQALAHYGDPKLEKGMVLFDVPTHLEIGVIPKKVYCNKDLVKPLTQAFTNLIERKLVGELKTWDGCFNNRPIRGFEKKFAAAVKANNMDLAASYLSLHSWGLAIDVNAAWNGLGKEPQLSPAFVKCFTDAGFTWGGTFKRKDGMHMELAELPK
jgi:hypothetical protein